MKDVTVSILKGEQNIEGNAGSRANAHISIEKSATGGLCVGRACFAACPSFELSSRIRFPDVSDLQVGDGCGV